MKKLLFPVLLITVVLSSCLKDEYNFEDPSIKLSPEVAVPLVKTQIVADDILSLVDSSFLSENAENLLEFKYSDTIYSVGMAEFIDVPDKSVNYNFNLTPITIDDIPLKTTKVRLDSTAKRMGGAFYASIQSKDGTTDDFPSFPPQNAGVTELALSEAPFNTATFSEGVLKLKIINGWPTELTDIEIAFKRKSDGIAIDTLRYASILPGMSLSDSIFLEGKTIEKNMQADFISLAGAGSSGPVLIQGIDTLGLEISGYNMVVVAGTAILPSQKVMEDTINVDFDLGFGEQLETLTMKEGELDFSLNYNVAENAKIYITLPYSTKNGIPFTDSILVAAGPLVVNRTFDLAGYSMDLTKGGIGYNSVQSIVSAEIISSGTVVPFDTANVVVADVSIQNVKPLFINGYFGSQTLSMDLDTNSFEIGDIEILKKMSFADPKVTLGFHNTFGIPMEISGLTLGMLNAPDQVYVTGLSLPFTIAGADAGSPGTAVTTNLIIDADATNIEEGINLWPDEVITGFTGGINPAGVVGNFATDTSKMDVTFDLTIPVYGTLSGYEIRDTLELDSSIFTNVDQALIRSNIENEFPLEGAVGIYIVDENFVILDSITDGLEILIEAASVDPVTGETVNVAEKRSDLVLDYDAILHLRNSAKIIIVAKLSTANNGAAAKIYSTYKMDIKLGLLANLNIELDTKNEEEDEE